MSMLRNERGNDMEITWNPTCPTMDNFWWPPGLCGKSTQLGGLSGKQGDHVKNNEYNSTNCPNLDTYT